MPTLEALIAAKHEIALVISQPDRPVGRTQQLTAPPVKETALAAGLEVTQPEKIKNNAEFRERLEAIAPDAIVVVAYGRIIPPWMLALPRLGCINLHASLLPKYRGAAPIQWAVAMGETVTGNTTMLLEEGLDTGPILLQREIPVSPKQTAADLFDVLAQDGAPLVVETLAGLERRYDQAEAAGSCTRDACADSGSGGWANGLCGPHGDGDFGIAGAGFQPWPGAYTTLEGKKLIAHQMLVAGERAGVIRARLTSPIIGCRLRVRRIPGLRSPSCRWKARSAWPPPTFCGARHCIPEFVLVKAMSAVSPARRVAFAILKTIEEGKGHSDDLLRGKNVSALSEADRHLTTALVLGVLRWQIDLDGRIRPLLKHPNAKLDAEVLIALRLGAFQLLLMHRIPAHAAIDESVEITKQAGHRFASGMVNAVLRKLAASHSEQARPTPEEADGRRGFPAWMVERWSANYGEEAACGICRYGQCEPHLTIRAVDGEIEADLAAEGVSLSPGRLLNSARQVISGDVTGSEAFRAGRVRLQDEGSQLVAEILPRGDTILDCCAAPGGKTLILAERNPEAHIVACESSPQRLAATA